MIALSCSLRFNHEIGIRNCHGNTNQFNKNMVGRGRFNLLSVALSSHVTMDALSLHIFGSVHCPISSVPCRYNLFVCRSSLVPSLVNDAAVVKGVPTALMRLYNSFNGSPAVLQLAPAVGVIAFALWCLEPVMKHCRNLFLHETDSSWRRSSTHYVLTSYVQPLLLWVGASLVCRALDPVILPSEASQAVKQRLLHFVRSFSAVLAFAYCLTSFIQQAQKLFVETNDSNDATSMGLQFAGKAIYSAVWVAAVSLFMELLGFSTQKWLTAGGLGTVLLTLAGREIFTNFLSSMMIHATRPFIVNEWIQTKIEGYDVSGTVEHVGWWSPTIIRGDDREAIHIPNHKFTVNVVRNLSQKTHWRIKNHIAISHLDVKKINNIVADMRKVLSKNPQVEQQRLHRRVFLENINPENQALMVLISCFVKTSHFEEYLCVKETILLDLLRVVSHHRARLATPIRTIQKRYSEADMENIPFSDIFTRARASTKSPILLIEPSYNIVGDDKSKAPSRPIRTVGEEVKASIASDSKADDEVIATPSDAKVDHTASEISSNSKVGGPKVTAASMAHLKEETLNRQPKKATSVDAIDKHKLGSLQRGVISDTPPKSQLEGVESTTLNLKDVTLHRTHIDKPPVIASDGSEKTEGTSPAASDTNQESEPAPVKPPPMVRPTLEENIVLGVALDGSRRTLPVEEEMDSASDTPDTKELTACRNGNGPQSDEKGTKTGQIPAVPGDQDR